MMVWDFCKRCDVVYIMSFFCLPFCFLGAQTFKIKDSITNKPVAFATITINHSVYYADGTGEFRADSLPPHIEVRIEKSGYESRYVNLGNIREDVLLKPRIYVIPELNIYPKKRYTIGKNNRKTITKIGILKEIEIGTFVKNPFGKAGLLKSIILPIKKMTSNNGYLVLNFYALHEGENIPTNIPPLNTTPVIIPLSELGKKNNKIDLTKQKIELPAFGLLIGCQISDTIGMYTTKTNIPKIEMFNNATKDFAYFKENDGVWKMYSVKTNVINYILEALF